MKTTAASSPKCTKSQTLQEPHSWRHLCALSPTPDDGSQWDPGCEGCLQLCLSVAALGSPGSTHCNCVSPGRDIFLCIKLLEPEGKKKRDNLSLKCP